MRDLRTASEVWRFLKPLPPLWRLHQTYRSLAFPFLDLLRYLPRREDGAHPIVILDLGCGHGVFLALVKMHRPDIQLIGLDLSAEKIGSARKAFLASGISVRELAVKDIANFSEQSVDVISIIDVMYLVPFERWREILQRCHQCLRPGGKLLLKEMNRSIRWKFVLLRLEETLAVRVLGLTLGRTFTFPTRAQVGDQLRQAGFAIEEVPLDGGYYVPHHLWIGTKTASTETDRT
jgi:2-polyprenyl-3-methyl-5-hydroxy-6-metoxy-1,4-benzoquinol methylase